jgi:hypothetical protein
VISAGLILALAVVGGSWLLAHLRMGPRAKAVSWQETGTWSGPVTAGAKELLARRVYPFSVVPGGVYSARELHVARAHDATVGEHYASFGANSGVERTQQDLYMFVSYRKSDRVYWTKTRHRIPKGELLLSDGSHLARTRCGNRLSATPQYPTIADEPSQAALDTPQFPERLPEPKLDLPELSDVSAYVSPDQSPDQIQPLPFEGAVPPPFADVPKTVVSGASGNPYEAAPPVSNGITSAFVGALPTQAVIPNGGGATSAPSKPNPVPEPNPSPVPNTPQGGLDVPEPRTIALIGFGFGIATLLLMAGIQRRRRSRPNIKP